MEDASGGALSFLSLSVVTEMIEWPMAMRCGGPWLWDARVIDAAWI